MAHVKVLTNAERFHRGAVSDDLCQCCLSALETLMHVVGDCEDVQLFWNRVIKAGF